VAEFTDGSDLSAETLTHVAELRARGRAWEDAAAAIAWGTDDLKRACRGNPVPDETHERSARGAPPSTTG
jgi:hypothetical protein